ncbi:Aste57867_12627 [Aphanomyces stellatus]|uniref:Aste57867_12627 protein n=1 Tax=Aphanomyces stellatus TaxID=120398 RepID=A0A485KWV5_9STRA|nr:hypothetical protein As57867_012581 [Aphanomyces stellatus]VFT89477.1 Aste57867_12627 [Aphanomyces stellatus]
MLYLLWAALLISAAAVRDVAGKLVPPAHDAILATRGLISRRLGNDYVDQFTFAVIPPTGNGLDVARISSKDGKIFLQGSSATAMGYGLHTYLKQVVHTQTDWEDHALQLPPSLPLPSSPIQLQKESKYTYYMNVCTASYSQWAWQWPKWEKHIDWMALNGINMPLAFTGQEKAWQATFARFNITSLDSFFAGASFLAWGRMGNIQGSWVRGPLPQSFIDDQFHLQQKILARMRTFGMLPALPAFAGHIPAEFTVLYPTAAVIQSAPWAGFQAPYTEVFLMDPTDPLFVEIGATFLREYQALYGFSAHVYQTDTYNEMDPRDASARYLGAASTAVLESMQTVDPDAVWLMQGWLFHFSSFWTLDRMEAYLTPLPKAHLIVLDLYSEVVPQWQKSSNYFGHDWIYCVLHNFGGSLGMRGDLTTLATDPITSRAASRGTMVGVGLTMEGIFQNYLVYDLALAMAWAKAPVHVSNYVAAFADARYHGGGDTTLQRAWAALETSVYNVPKAFGGVTKNIACSRPRWNLVQKHFMPTEVLHDVVAVQEAWRLLLSAPLPHVESYTHDLVDVGRQVLSDRTVAAYTTLSAMFHAHEATDIELETQIQKFLQPMVDANELLNTHVDFMLGPWLHDARALAHGNQSLETYYEYEARNQITRWGDNNFNALSDYAGKEWAGLLQTYYLPRWAIWTKYVLQAYQLRQPVDDASVRYEVEAFELAWQLESSTTDDFPITAIGDPVGVARRLFERYVGGDLPPHVVAPDAAMAALPASVRRDDAAFLADTRFCLLDCLW